MDEATIRLEVSNMMYAQGNLCYHPPDMGPIYDRGKTESKDDGQGEKKERINKGPGHVDLLILNPVAESILIEVKRIDMEDGPRLGHNGNLYFNAISLSQRRTLDRWCYHLDGEGYLAIGTIETIEKRRLWIIPWKAWVVVEKAILNLDKPGKGIRVYSPDAHMGITDFFSGFECVWLGVKTDVHWELPEFHPILAIRTWKPRPENEFMAVSARFEEKK